MHLRGGHPRRSPRAITSPPSTDAEPAADAGAEAAVRWLSRAAIWIATSVVIALAFGRLMALTSRCDRCGYPLDECTCGGAG